MDYLAEGKSLTALHALKTSGASGLSSSFTCCGRTSARAMDHRTQPATSWSPKTRRQVHMGIKPINPEAVAQNRRRAQPKKGKGSYNRKNKETETWLN